MKPWAPLSLTRTGAPIVGQVPVRMVVYGDGTLTPHQSAMLQSVFVGFVDMARQSVGNNPSAQGLLPDGSQYNINCVGGVCTCAVWPVSGELRRSGIVVSLVNLDGTLIPKHTDKDGKNIAYLLMPGTNRKLRRERKSAADRRSTGQWKYRILKDPKGGGKAVNATMLGDPYLVGVQGRSDNSFPFTGGRYGGTNARAYAIEAGDPLVDRFAYENGREKERSFVAESPLPFFVFNDDGKRFVAQLVVAPASGGGTDFILEVGPPGGDRVPVGQWFFPAYLIFGWWGISFRPDGREARLAYTDQRNSNRHRGTFHIEPTTDPLLPFALTFTAGEGVPQSSGEERTGPPPINEGATDYDGSTHNVSVSHTFLRTRLGPEKVVQRGSSSLLYAFGHRGEEHDLVTHATTRTTETVSSLDFEERTRSGPGIVSLRNRHTVRSYHQTQSVLGGADEISLFVGKDFAGGLEYELKTDTEVTSVTVGEEFQYAGVTTFPSFGGTTTEYRLGYGAELNAVFYSRDLQFAIYREYVPPSRRVTQALVAPPAGSTADPSFGPGTVLDTLASYRVSMKYKSQVTVIKNLSLSSPGNFRAFVAADPLTGALLVNLQRVTPSGTLVLDSWLYLVDDVGVRPLSSVMKDVPPSARVQSNEKLYSL